MGIHRSQRKRRNCLQKALAAARGVCPNPTCAVSSSCRLLGSRSCLASVDRTAPWRAEAGCSARVRADRKKWRRTWEGGVLGFLSTRTLRAESTVFAVPADRYRSGAHNRVGECPTRRDSLPCMSGGVDHPHAMRNLAAMGQKRAQRIEGIARRSLNRYRKSQRTVQLRLPCTAVGSAIEGCRWNKATRAEQSAGRRQNNSSNKRRD